MQVRITNVTDGPGQKPVEVRIYNKRLRPGAHMDVPIQFIDDKTRRLEEAGAIIIGKLPPWYADYEAKRKVRNLTPEEVARNVKIKNRIVHLGKHETKDTKAHQQPTEDTHKNLKG